MQVITRSAGERKALADGCLAYGFNWHAVVLNLVDNWPYSPFYRLGVVVYDVVYDVTRKQPTRQVNL